MGKGFWRWYDLDREALIAKYKRQFVEQVGRINGA
jgi:hypothetical protein